MDRSSERLRRLDGLRGIAACVVAFVFHARALFGAWGNPFEGIPVIAWAQHWGWSAVDLFFVLSGFVFAHCYLDRWRLRPGTTVSNFALARFARLWPLHALMLVLAILVTAPAPATTWQNSLLSLAMLQVAAADPTQTLNGPAWSLSVEAVCYAIFIAAAVAGPRILRAATVAAMLAGAYWIIEAGVWNALIARGLLGFFCGAMLRQWAPSTVHIPTLALIPPALLSFIMVPDGAWLVPTTLIAWPAVILLALRTRVMEARPLLWLGDRSYAIYLTHIPLYGFAIRLLDDLQPLNTAGWFAVLIPIWVFVLLVADLLYRRVERPMQKAILTRFGGAGSRAADKAAAEPDGLRLSQ